jgi:hypothetical protein
MESGLREHIDRGVSMESGLREHIDRRVSMESGLRKYINRGTEQGSCVSHPRQYEWLVPIRA